MGDIHTLTVSNVRETVPSRAGYYKLYNSNGGPVRYVGSSGDLEERLQTHAREGEYRFFEFGYASNREQAYKQEAKLYHQYGNGQLNNERHPPRPTKRVKCPECTLHE